MWSGIVPVKVLHVSYPTSILLAWHNESFDESLLSEVIS